jgi:hypothetical protein
MATAPPSVAIVSVLLAAAPDGVTLGGAKVQVAPLGNPAQLKETAAEKPFCGVTEIVVCTA